LLSQEALTRHRTEKVKISLVLFDEIEKASDALWNLLLGILDKGVLTLGDNRKVDFSSSMVFLTSNLGASEMCALSNLQSGCHSPAQEDDGGFRGGRDAKISQIGAAAARRKFTPEFINRLDRILVFKPLGNEELRKILDIELDVVQQRLHVSAGSTYFEVSLTASAREFLLTAGTDSRYGARHLKRAIERLLVQPLSNLMASGQIRRGDCIVVNHDENSASLTFFREAVGRDVWKFAGSVAA